MLASKQCCFGKLEHWTQMKPGGRVRRRGWRPKLDTSVIRSALKGENREQGKKEGEQEAAWWWVLSCIGKTTLAELRGLRCSQIPPSSPISVFNPIMKHSDRDSAQVKLFHHAHRRRSFCTTTLSLIVTCAFFSLLAKYKTGQ